MCCIIQTFENSRTFASDHLVLLHSMSVPRSISLLVLRPLSLSLLLSTERELSLIALDLFVIVTKCYQLREKWGRERDALPPSHTRLFRFMFRFNRHATS